MKKESYNLIERAAHKLAKTLFTEFEKIQELEILVKKINAPIQADFKYAAVVIYRKRGREFV